MENISYQCPKCQNTAYETDVFRATGGGLSRFFDVQSKKFTTVSCKKCGYTELYKDVSSGAGNILDFLFGG